MDYKAAVDKLCKIALDTILLVERQEKKIRQMENDTDMSLQAHMKHISQHKELLAMVVLQRKRIERLETRTITTSVN